MAEDDDKESAWDRGEALGRAGLTFASVVHSHFDERTGLFGARTRVGRRRYEALWPYANGWSALCALASASPSGSRPSMLPGVFESLEHYSDSDGLLGPETGPIGFSSAPGRSRPGHGGVFFDDNAWVGLALVRHFGLTEDERALNVARRVFEFVMTGWSDDASWAKPGGIEWRPGPSSVSRNTCSNGPAAELAVSLFLLSGESRHLDQGLAIYGWARDALLGDDHLYADRISPRGEVAGTVWSYNQGSMIGAGVLLHQATGQSEFLDQATATAGAALARFSVPALMGQEPAFNAIFFRNLGLLAAMVADHDARTLASAFSAAMWGKRRDNLTGLFAGQGSAFNNSMAMVEIDATIGGVRPGP
jgi:hypothetical protein